MTGIALQHADAPDWMNLPVRPLVPQAVAQNVPGEGGPPRAAGALPAMQSQSGGSRLQKRMASVQVWAGKKFNYTKELRFSASVGDSRYAEEKAALVAQLKSRTHAERAAAFLCEWKPALLDNFLIHKVFSFEWNPSA